MQFCIFFCEPFTSPSRFAKKEL